MVSRFVLLIQYLIVIIFLSSRERSFPIQLRRWRRNRIGAFPSGLYPDGFSCLRFDLFGLQHSRDHDHNSLFSKLRKDFHNQIWDPGDSIYKPDSGGLRSLIRQTYGILFAFVVEIGILFLTRTTVSLLLCIDVSILFHLMVLSFGIKEELLEFKTRGINLRFAAVMAIPLSDQLVAPVNVCLGCVSFSFVMEISLHQFGFCPEMSNLHMGLVNYWRQGLVSFVQIWRMKSALVTFGCEPFDMRRSDIWDAMENLSVVMLERITKSTYFKKTLVQKFWCHHVYTSELALDTSAFMLRFVKRSVSHKLLHTNRNKEKSNMKLDNNRFFYRLASKATLRKASSNSLLLYFS